MGIKCFMLSPTDEYVVSLRRYTGSSNPCPNMPGTDSYCNANKRIDVFRWNGVDKARVGDNDYKGDRAWGWIGDPISCDGPYPGITSRLDHRWPKECDLCHQPFPDQTAWQLHMHILLSRSDHGPVTTIREAPAGACYDAPWFHGQLTHCGLDGRSLWVVLPGGRPWGIDTVSSNCTRPKDRKHHCWFRHGEPPNLTVDKVPPKGWMTCSAGGGSIVVPGWHGFLRNGELVEA